MLVDNGIVRVGMEIEVVRWNKKRTYQAIAKELIEAGYMLGTPDDWSAFHNYGCKCSLGCGFVRSGDVFYPPLASLTYDASLPETGAEFVTSTVLLEENGLNELRDIWNIVVRDAVWDDQAINKRGGKSSPSVHLHVSALQEDAPPPGMVPSSEANVPTIDAMHALSLFGPEFIALASAAGYTRGLTYRKPIRNADQNGHHGFVHIRKLREGYAYIEWRMFEAAYENWDYIEASAYLAASITRALTHLKDAIPGLMRGGYSGPIHADILNEAVRTDNVKAVLALYDRGRLSALREFCLAGLYDDMRGQALLSDLFDKTESLYGH